jgi:hypothetical protein
MIAARTAVVGPVSAVARMIFRFSFLLFSLFVSRSHIGVSADEMGAIQALCGDRDFAAKAKMRQAEFSGPFAGATGIIFSRR